MRFFFVIALFIFSFSLGKTQEYKLKGIKNKLTTYHERKVAIKDFQFQNFQFELDKSILNDSITLHWYELNKSLNKKFPGFELFNPGTELADTNYFIPAASRFSAHIFHDITFNDDSLIYKVGEINGYVLSKMYLPFYFKNVEVSNLEYREFVTYVRDSIARRMLAEEFPNEFLIIPQNFNEERPYGAFPLNWKKEFRYYDPELMPFLTNMYFPDHEKFYWRRQFDVSKFIYKYYTVHENYYDPELFGKEHSTNYVESHSLKIYPDTLTWINDFHFARVDPMNRNYFWHEAYDDYPVVGITWEQAKAFCHWKADQLNKKLAKEKFPFRVEVGIPKEEEWEYVISQYFNHSNGQKSPIYNIQKYPFAYTDLDWKSNLVFKWSDKFFQEIKHDTIIEMDSMVYHLKYKTSYSVPNLIVSDNELKGYYEAATIGYLLVKYADKKSDQFHVVFETLAFNASEWMDEDFSGSYDYYWSMRTAAMITDSIPEQQKPFRNEIINYSRVANNLPISQSGKLVRGSNWFDQGSPNLLDFEMKYAHRKAFVPKDSSYSTLGFRYVIRLIPKE